MHSGGIDPERGSSGGRVLLEHRIEAGTLGSGEGGHLGVEGCLALLPGLVVGQALDVKGFLTS